MTRLNGTAQFLQSTLASMGKRKKKASQYFRCPHFCLGRLTSKKLGLKGP